MLVHAAFFGMGMGVGAAIICALVRADLRRYGCPDCDKEMIDLADPRRERR